jgi:cell division protein FtsL
MEPFEYAIRKDVRNNPIVREVDEAREREQWKWLGLAGVLVIVMLLSAWQHWVLRQHGYDLVAVQRQLASEEHEGRQLLLQLEELRSPSRIEEIALKKLHMVQPTLEESIVIERVEAAEPPARSVVAQR